MLSIKEFLLIAALVCFVMFLVLYSLRGSRIRGISELLLANALGAFAFLLYAFGKELPPLIAYEGANGLYAAAAASTFVGFRRLFDRPVPMLAIAVAMALFVVAIAVFHYWFYSHAARTIIVSIFQTGTMIAIARTVLSARKEWQPPRYPLTFTVSMCVAIALGHIFRGMEHVLNQDAPKSLLEPAVWNVFVLAAGSLSFPILTLGGLLIAHRAIVAVSENVANRDFLTGAWSRRAFFEIGNREIARCRSTNRKLALLLIDLDNFKTINDTLGHSVGDETLVQLVRRANNGIRSIDHLSRIGGDEFAVLLPETDLPGAAATASRLKQELEESDENLQLPNVTFSIGAAVLRDDDTLHSLLKRADAALYEAKSAGRDCVGVERSDPAEEMSF
jgi:diguanylate cyclase (GGDEF)-like protein